MISRQCQFQVDCQCRSQFDFRICQSQVGDWLMKEDYTWSDEMNDLLFLGFGHRVNDWTD